MMKIIPRFKAEREKPEAKWPNLREVKMVQKANKKHENKRALICKRTAPKSLHKISKIKIRRSAIKKYPKSIKG